MAIRFNAATDQIELASAPSSSDPITVTAWVRNQESVASGTFFRLRAGGTIATFGASAGGLNGPTLATTGGTAGPIIGSDSFPVGSWRAIAFTISGTGSNNCTVFWSGTDGAGGSTTTSAGTVATGSPTALSVGGRGGGDTSERWGGDLAHVRVWTSALSQGQIETEWASATAVVTSNLWADWPLTDHNTLTDASGNGRHLSAGSTATDDTDGPIAAPTNAPAGNASGTGTAHSPTVSVSASVGHASGTGTAHAPTGSVSASAGSASGTGAANAATGSVAASAGSASGTGTAHGPAGSVGATAGSAAGTGTAHAAIGSVSASAGSASGTGTAHQPEVTTATSEATAHAGHASGTGTAHQPTVVTALPSADAPAGHASGVGRAHNPTVRTVGLPIGSSGWQKLRAMFVEKAPAVVLVDCPNCGWPLQEARGVRFCPHGDYRSRS